MISKGVRFIGCPGYSSIFRNLRSSKFEVSVSEFVKLVGVPQVDGG